MDTLMQWVITPGIIISLVFSVVFSFKSRRSTDPNDRGIHASKMNISMGIMLLFISSVQLLLSNESTLRIVIGALFLLIGVFNLFAGLRNLGIYRARKG